VIVTYVFTLVYNTLYSPGTFPDVRVSQLIVIIRRLVILRLTGTSTVELARDGTDNVLNLQ
jgi:hypothetical protein